MMEENVIKLREYAKSSPWDYTILTDQMKGIEAPPITTPIPEDAVKIKLPAPNRIKMKDNGLYNDIVHRRSCRAYGTEPMTLEELSFLLFCTHGFKSMRDHSTFATLRTVPSAGARHAIETYLAVMNVEGLKKGLYLFLPVTHELMFIEERGDELNQEVVDATVGQLFAGTAQVVFFWAADMYRCEWRYSTHAYKLVCLDVGHVCQNLYLACEEIDYGTCAIAAYDQEKCDKLLHLNGENDFVIYLAPVGRVK